MRATKQKKACMIIFNLDEKKLFKSIELLPDAIKINSNYRSHNLSYSYSEIESFRLDIETVWFQGRYRGYYVCKKFILHFKTKEGRIFTVEKHPLIRVIKPIYDIIDATRKIENFEFQIVGGGEPYDLSEKIEKYRKLGYKDSLGEKAKKEVHITSSIIIALPCLLFITSHILKLFVLESDFSYALTREGAQATSFFLPIALAVEACVLYDTIQDNVIQKTVYENRVTIRSAMLEFLIKIIVSIITYVVVF